MNVILHKDHLPGFLRKLGKSARLVAPVKNHYGDTLFTEIESIDRQKIDLENQPQTSAKPFLLPQREVLFRYQEDGHLFSEVNEATPMVLFGLRSCDLAAILYLDVIFLGETKDPYYRKRRENTLLISLACNDPFDNCFCLAAKSGPCLEFGFDLQFTDLGDRFFVETGRAGGERLIEEWPLFFRPATAEDDKARYQARLEAQGRFKRRVLLEEAARHLEAGLVPESVWESLSGRCQDCGGCAYLCPTCTCYQLTDSPDGKGGGERLRLWDACTFAGFTVMAGGHNPVDMRRERIKRRFTHKLRDDVRRHGRSSCVGCGRCVGMCFGGVDMIRFIDLATENTED